MQQTGNHFIYTPASSVSVKIKNSSEVVHIVQWRSLQDLMEAIPLYDKIEVYIYILFIYLRLYTTIAHNSK